jgi:uncharacterized protein YecE (DUF72 family)
MKAWQLITHNATSPTYRRLKSALDTQDRTSVGSFRPTEQVWDAWQRTLVISRAVEASVIVFQCPKSFLPTGENLVNFSAFFRRIERGTFQIAWEPRGEAWTDDLVSELCTEHDLLHCVDPFQSTSVYGALTYWRLHGRGAYSYKYTDHDLELLKRLLLQQGQPAYCMFNNFSSKADALRFLHLLGPQRPGPWVAP